MNKIIFIAKRFVVNLLLYCLICSPIWGDAVDNKLTSISEDQLKERIEQLPSVVDLRYTSEVHSIINTYINRYRKGSEILLGRVEKYFPIYEHHLNESGMPDELKYLSIVESALRPHAVSHTGAVGLWQFMKSTGKLYGLRINSAVDERRDPIRSTEAAAAYLKDLHEEFGDWTLAMAAYNCGPGNVRKAIRRSGGDEFWEIKRYLPRETRRYIPKYVAITYVMNYFQAHGLEPIIRAEKKPLSTVRIYDYATLRTISQQSGLDISKIRDLNPSYLKGYIPKNSNGYLLTLTEEAMLQYLTQWDGKYDLVMTTQPSEYLTHQLQLLSSMRKRAQEFKVSPLITRLNRGQVTSFQQSLAPKYTGPGFRWMNDWAVANDFTDQPYSYHKLRAQQSLLDVAQLYETKLDQVMKWNNIDLNNLPPPGTLIRVKTE